MDLKLNLLIDRDDLRTIRDAGENVLIAKPTEREATNVAWLDFDPFEANSVEWSEEFGLYVSNTAMEHGASIQKLSDVFPAAERAVYALEDDATFHGPTSQQVPPGAFGVDNQMPTTEYRALTFGLTQSAVVNGNQLDFRPINAQSVPAGQESTFTPKTTLFVWLDATIESQTVITHVTSRQTKVVFSGAVQEHTLRYDASVGKFVVEA